LSLTEGRVDVPLGRVGGAWGTPGGDSGGDSDSGLPADAPFGGGDGGGAAVAPPATVEADVRFVDPTRPVSVVPVVRSGLVLVEQCSLALPSQRVYHVGLRRARGGGSRGAEGDAVAGATGGTSGGGEGQSSTVDRYLSTLPPAFEQDERILVADAVLATGDTICHVLDEIVRRGADPGSVRVVAAVAAPPALGRLSERFPGLRVYCGMIDAEVDEYGRVIPGIGWAGDRCFGTGG